ncbi:MAG: 3-phosphoshikimate 1-carboxyvinyltransferase [Candidatus Omnitrophota bacterium]|nr:3-phosphoshikimate 1-carboxyvinyltransferase [Candidatus Omnitrophota bacterium]
MLRSVSLVIPPDKSISHRVVMLAAISKGNTRIKNLLMAEDIKRTIEVFRAMGVKILPLTLTLSPKGRGNKESRLSPSGRGKGEGDDVIVNGVGMRGLKKPFKELYLGNSGTTMRILPGILAGQGFEAKLTGDRSLSGRPMKRIAEPLRKMGASVTGREGVLDSAKYSSSEVEKTILPRSNNIDIYPPLVIKGGRLKAIKYRSKVASAQVKSCILLAGLYASGVTAVTEPEKSRDHTERMLKQFGVKIFSTREVYPERSRGTRSKNIVRAIRLGGESRTVSLKGPAILKSPGVVEVPGDISSAAFFIVAGCILPDTKIIIKNVGLNPTRTGVLDILRKMGADVQLRKVPAATCEVGQAGEPVGDIVVKPSQLKGVTISPKEVAGAIDEMPIIMVAACFAKGKTVIRGAGELRVKETDRIKSMATNLRKLGADVQLRKLPAATCEVGQSKREEIVINGGKPLHGARVSSFGDHRTAMSMLVAGLRTKGRIKVTGLECINKSFPNFLKLLEKINF